ncbi:hypothetical protein TWF694_007861 [Orbilia ellipsospora]|uniref:Ubiquitin-like protein smt3 n=1 Tax=Orbilia ellipsospora TaxID=2528407 RepID=A0AAV9XMD3_9PEZI
MPGDIRDESLLNPNGAATTKKAPPKKKKKPVVADSWDDELSSADEQVDGETEDNGDTTLLSDASPSITPAPPAPTPAVATPFLSENGPSSSSYYAYDPDTHSRAGGFGEAVEGQRQAKTDAVARRMIASALGVRSRSTKEQREYDASLKKKHQEEREERKKEEAEREKAKAAIWDD